MVLHRLDKLTEARAAFIETENPQQQCQAERPMLYSLPGAQYCALLLDVAKNVDEIRSVLQRGEYSLEIFIKQVNLLSVAIKILLN